MWHDFCRTLTKWDSVMYPEPCELPPWATAQLPQYTCHQRVCSQPLGNRIFLADTQLSATWHLLLFPQTSLPFWASPREQQVTADKLVGSLWPDLRGAGDRREPTLSLASWDTGCLQAWVASEEQCAHFCSHLPLLLHDYTQAVCPWGKVYLATRS